MENIENLTSEGSHTKKALQTADKSSSLWNVLDVSVNQCIVDGELTILWANDRFYESIGYAGDKCTSVSTMRQLYQEYPEEFIKLSNAVESAIKKSSSKFSVDCRMPVKEKGFIWVRISCTVTQETVNGHAVLYAVYTDISDLIRQHEKTNRMYDEKAESFEWLMDEYVGNIYISDMNTYELLYLNKTSCATLHTTKEKLLGRKCYEVIQGRTSPCPFCTNQYLSEDKFYEWEFDNPVLERTFLIKNRIVNWFGHRSRIELSHDMYSTEYKLAKKDRERDALIRTIPGGFVRIDARDFSTVLWYGAGFLQMIGYTKEQFENKLHSKCTYIHPEDLEQLQSVLKKIKETGESRVIEIRVISHEGEVKTLTNTLCYVSGEESWDGIPSFYSVGIDVTQERMEQKRQHKALEDAYQSARVANSAKTNFLSSMSHDIRTPMNAIMGMAAIAQANLSSPEKVHSCLNKINVSSRHLLSLINEVLDMSKIESGKIDLLPENIHLPELIQNVSDMCKPLVAEKKQEFKINIGKVRHEKIIADGDRLQQVFMNLLSNAIKYTPEGGKISLIINEKPSSIDKKGQFEFIFTDNGIGMPEEFVPHIFEPFSRAEDSRISKIQGTGLGMAITENIVRMMNGSIHVTSQLGVGSQFTVTAQFELIDEEVTGDSELEGLPVLVVDDDKMVCENVTALLNELGMRGYWVLSGMEAVQSIVEAHLRNDDFFAVILDWKMPEMDGLDTVKAIRKKLGKNVPIIIISAYDYYNIEDEFIKAGADAFITKPLFKSKVLHVLQLFCTSNKIETASALAETKHPELVGKKILLAEDNDLNREIAVELLEMQGVSVNSVENGSQAVEEFSASRTGEYAAILMDIQMPVMDGYQATKAIRCLSRDDAQTVPVLALTANAFMTDMANARSAGMNDHISKPIDVERLIEVLQKWIR